MRWQAAGPVVFAQEQSAAFLKSSFDLCGERRHPGREDTSDGVCAEKVWSQHFDWITRLFIKVSPVRELSVALDRFSCILFSFGSVSFVTVCSDA